MNPPAEPRPGARLAPLAPLLLACACGSTRAHERAPLPSWSDGPPRQAILDFVARVTEEGGPDFVPAPQRIAVFDNDGTLWSEQPLYFQLLFALDRVKQDWKRIYAFEKP